MKEFSLIFMTFSVICCAAKPKNVLILVADDMGFEIGAYNNTVIDTPNIDSLTKKGLLFNRAYTSVSSCSPSRSAILTGLPQHQNGMYGLHHAPHNFNSLTRVQSLPRILHEHSIKTGIIGKKHVGPESVYPFDFAYTEENISLLQVGRNITRMRELARLFFQQTQRPFLLYIGFFDPHRCGSEPESGYGLFCERFGSGEPGQGVIPDWKPVWYDPEEVVVPYFVPDNPDSRHDLSRQYTSINRMDQGVGLILEELRSAGHADDTLVLFTSDNGIPFPAAKTNLYTPGMAEPMVLSSPAHRERWGQESNAMVSLLDIVPTVLDWFSIPYPRYRILSEAGEVHLTGRSMLPLLEHEPIPRWDIVYASHDFHEVTMNYPMRVIHSNQYKLIHNLNYRMPYPIAEDIASSPSYMSILVNASEHRPINWYRSLHQYYYRDYYELFDLRRDPQELNNLQADPKYSALLAQLKKQLSDWRNVTGDPWFCSPGGVLIPGHKLHCLDMHNGLTPLK